ncbi:MAG: cell division protein SepF [Bacilli bacterium]|nr:cell division protein SepF [Mollicutes bacterium]MDY3899346.1 cell division protein SepF [Bacilli bacterium]
MFRKKKREEQLGTSFDRLYNYNYDNSKSIDEQFMRLADIIIDNRPVIINFEGISSSIEINRAVAFLSGVVYGLNGEVHRLGNETFLFASHTAFEDGSLRCYVSDVGKE